jgi:hypothetical protein
VREAVRERFHALTKYSAVVESEKVARLYWESVT